MEKIKQGYQRTDIGLIPTDWEVVELGDVSKYEGGSQPYLSYFSNRCLDGYIRLIQIRDYKTDKYAVYIPNNLARKTCNENDIMIGRYGPPIFQILRGLNGAYNVALIKAIPNEKIDQSYFYYTLKREDLFQLIELLSRRSSGQTGVDLVGLKAFKIGLPTKSEQFNIATALSNIDNLIAALNKKITKKQQIKQGAMQQLLTGKKRLPGFSGDWKNVILSDIVDDFIVPMRDKPKNLKGNIPWCRIEDFNGMYLLGSQSEQGVDIETVKSMNLKIYPIGTLLVSCSAYLGRCAIVGKELVTNQTFIGLFPSKKCNVEFLYYAMKREEKSLNSLSSGTTISYLSREQFESYPLFIPSKSEQTAIARVLTDMDNEISQLEEDRNKYEQIKAGMMQQLLTGEIRLVN